MAKRTNYDRGREIEYKIMDKLTSEGYLVLRSAGSHSKIDVLGLRKDRIVAVQSKRTKKFTQSAYREEIEAIQQIIRDYQLPQVEWVFAVWIDRQGFREWIVTADEVKEVDAS